MPVIIGEIVNTTTPDCAPYPSANPIADAMAVVTNAMREDDGYLIGWHANIAQAVADAGCPRHVAQEGAARFLEILSGIDVRKHPWFPAPDTRPKPEQTTAAPSVEPENKQLDDQFCTAVAEPETTPGLVEPRDELMDSVEAEIQSKGLTAPRVTPADIEASIASEHYFTAHDGRLGAAQRCATVGVYRELQLLTFCVLVLRNGFTVTGQSACASPENFDAELGRKIARADAIRQVWPLLGYALRERMAQDQARTVSHHPV